MGVCELSQMEGGTRKETNEDTALRWRTLYHGMRELEGIEEK